MLARRGRSCITSAAIFCKEALLRSANFVIETGAVFLSGRSAIFGAKILSGRRSSFLKRNLSYISLRK
jgi:hypothetical protein